MHVQTRAVCARIPVFAQLCNVSKVSICLQSVGLRPTQIKQLVCAAVIYGSPPFASQLREGSVCREGTKPGETRLNVRPGVTAGLSRHRPDNRLPLWLLVNARSSPGLLYVSIKEISNPVTIHGYSFLPLHRVPCALGLTAARKRFLSWQPEPSWIRSPATKDWQGRVSPT